MNSLSDERIPVNLIAGPLGVGKTTMINHLLQRRPGEERWAVLVNEYGLVGLDAALMTSDTSSGQPTGIEIREVAGGCICCSAGFMFEMSLALLLQRRPHRLLIEPTGLAALSGILDTLNRPGIREAVDVRTVFCLVDPGRLHEATRRGEVSNQVEAADVLLATRPDLRTADELDAFRSWAASLFPPKRFVGQVESGNVEVALLDLVANRGVLVDHSVHGHGSHHQHRAEVHAEIQPDASRPIQQRCHRAWDVSTVGWICWKGLVFDADRVSSWLRELAHVPGARRTKAVVRTDRGWWGFNFADMIEDVKPSGYRRDSRLEVVIENARVPDVDGLEQKLRACLTR